MRFQKQTIRQSSAALSSRGPIRAMGLSYGRCSLWDIVGCCPKVNTSLPWFGSLIIILGSVFLLLTLNEGQQAAPSTHGFVISQLRCDGFCDAECRARSPQAVGYVAWISGRNDGQ